MTNKEAQLALANLKRYISGGGAVDRNTNNAINMAISALEKQEQTKEAIPHRNYQYLSDYWCECGWHLGKKGDVKFCADCGRRIKWD